MLDVRQLGSSCEHRDGPEIGTIALKGLFDRKGLDPELCGAYDRKGAGEQDGNEP